MKQTKRTPRKKLNKKTMKQFLSEKHKIHSALAKDLKEGSKIVIARHQEHYCKGEIFALPGTNVGCNLTGYEIATVEGISAMGGAARIKTDLGEFDIYLFNDTVILVDYKLKVPDLTGKIIAIKKKWKSATGDVIPKGTELEIKWHGVWMDQHESVKVTYHTRNFIINISYFDQWAHTRYAINKVLLKKLAAMNEKGREEWFKENQHKIDFDLFRKVYRQLATDALSKKDHALHDSLMALQAHADSWEPALH
jgi:hypothetical protein